MPTINIQRILCPTDFSPFSAMALRHAVALARKFESRLKFVYVIPHVFPGGESIYGGAPWIMSPDVRVRAEEELRRFLEPVREARVDHEIEVREGEPWREILAATEEMVADLVVLGTHGRGGLDRFILGSVAEKLSRRLPCPVLTVSHEEGRTWAAPGLISRVLCATDFSESAGEALGMAVALAAKHGAEVTLLNVVESLPDFGDASSLGFVDVRPLRAEVEKSVRERLVQMAKAVDEPGMKIDARVIFGRAYKEILRTAAEDRSDLIVIGAQGHGIIEHMLAGSNAQHVIRGATCPVLTVRPVSAKRRDANEPHGLTLADPAASRGVTAPRGKPIVSIQPRERGPK